MCVRKATTIANLISFFFCVVSACNRTYYGDVGRTYELEIRRPREDKLPFLCHLNFTAAGSSYGDLVQVSGQKFYTDFIFANFPMVLIHGPKILAAASKNEFFTANRSGLRSNGISYNPRLNLFRPRSSRA